MREKTLDRHSREVGDHNEVADQRLLIIVAEGLLDQYVRTRKLSDFGPLSEALLRFRRDLLDELYPYL